jgi:hypothetical protein
MSFKVAGLHIAVIVASLMLSVTANARTITLVGFGDSLMAGYQLAARGRLSREAAGGPEGQGSRRADIAMPAFPATRRPAALRESTGRFPTARTVSFSNSAPMTRCAVSRLRRAKKTSIK